MLARWTLRWVGTRCHVVILGSLTLAGTQVTCCTFNCWLTWSCCTIWVFCDGLSPILQFGCYVMDYYPSYGFIVLWCIVTHHTERVFCDGLLPILWCRCSVMDYYLSYGSGVLWWIITHLTVWVFCGWLLPILRFGCSVIDYYPSFPDVSCSYGLQLHEHVTYVTFHSWLTWYCCTVWCAVMGYFPISPVTDWPVIGRWWYHDVQTAFVDT